MEDLERKAKALVERFVTKEYILSLLKTMVGNMHLSYLNLLLVADQRPEAKCVCGKKAWNRLGREINLSLTRKVVCQDLRQVALNIDKEDIREELIALADKLETCKPECVAKICKLKMKMALFSYLPAVLDLKRINLWMEERVEYDEK